MGDSETVVAQPSAVTGYSSEGYSADRANGTPDDTVRSATAAGGDVTADVPTDVGDITTSSANMDTDATHDQGVGDELVDHKDQISASDTNPDNMDHDAAQNLTSNTSVPMDTSQVAAYSSLNGNDATEAKGVLSAGINENGIASDVNDSVSVHQPDDVPGIYIYSVY